MMRFGLLTLFIVASIASCKFAPQSGKGRSGKNANSDDQGADQSGDHETQSQADYCSKIKDKGRGSLAVHLYTPREACDVKPWAMKFAASKNEQEETREVLKASEALRSYMEDFLNRAVKTPAASPGRKFHVRIMVDESQNAYADGRQNIVVNSAFLQGKTSAENMLGVLCHEMTHSLRNDYGSLEDLFEKNRIDDTENDPKAKALYDRIDAYLAKAYDEGSKTYTHNKRGYDAVIGDWNAYRKIYWDFSKRMEATADVVGGGICASLGMDPKSFSGVFEGLKAAEGEVSEPTDLQNGDQLEATSDQLFGWVFPDDTHPTYDERIDQIKRLDGFFRSHMVEDHELLDEWNQKFPELLKKLSEASAWSLTDAPSVPKDRIRIMNKTTGEVVTFPYHPSRRGRP